MFLYLAECGGGGGTGTCYPNNGFKPVRGGGLLLRWSGGLGGGGAEVAGVAGEEEDGEEGGIL
jgi:hypothetical protein